jgi:hypothetical protein
MLYFFVQICVVKGEVPPHPRICIMLAAFFIYKVSDLQCLKYNLLLLQMHLLFSVHVHYLPVATQSDHYKIYT